MKIELDASQLVGQTVRCYRNLHNGMLSVQIKTPKGWRVAGHLKDLALKDARYVVSRNGRERVLKERKKYVHAFVIGEVLDISPNSDLPRRCKAESVVYNPYKGDSFFYLLNGKPIEYSFYCFIEDCRLFAAY